MPGVNEKTSARDGVTPKNIVSRRMRQARRRFIPKLSQEDLAARIESYGVHIDRLGIGRIESGKRTVLDFELRAIAAALYVPISWLVCEEEIWESISGIPDRPDVVTDS